MNLPTADDLFRPTDLTADEATPRERMVRAVPTATDDPPARKPSGRVRHDEKITIYVTADELLDLEHARLALRRDHGLAVDRGRLVRAAVSLVLADLDEKGFDSLLVQRLIDQ